MQVQNERTAMNYARSLAKMDGYLNEQTHPQVAQTQTAKDAHEQKGASVPWKYPRTEAFGRAENPA